MSHQTILAPNEKIVKEFSISPSFFVFLVIVGIALTIGLPLLIILFLALVNQPVSSQIHIFLWPLSIIIGLVFITYAFYFRAARHYFISTHRISETKGLVARRTISTEYDDVTNIRISQDMIERIILKTGMVAIDTAGGDAEEIKFERVADPYQLASLIRKHYDARMRELGNGTHRPTGGPSISAEG